MNESGLKFVLLIKIQQTLISIPQALKVYVFVIMLC